MTERSKEYIIIQNEGVKENGEIKYEVKSPILHSIQTCGPFISVDGTEYYPITITKKYAYDVDINGEKVIIGEYLCSICFEDEVIIPKGTKLYLAKEAWRREKPNSRLAKVSYQLLGGFFELSPKTILSVKISKDGNCFIEGDRIIVAAGRIQEVFSKIETIFFSDDAISYLPSDTTARELIMEYEDGTLISHNEMVYLFDKNIEKLILEFVDEIAGK